MNTSSKRIARKARLPLVAIIPSLILVLVATVPHIYADKPTATVLVTDKANLPLSNQFGVPDQFVMSDAGDVLFTSGNSTALLRWSGGVKTRLLQAGDSYPGFANSTIEDLVATPLVENGLGHAAMTNFFVRKGVRPSRGVFVLDGTSFNKVALGGEVAPGSGGNTFFNFNQLKINDSDQVAFRARLEPPGIGPLGLFIGSPTGAPAKIALPGEAAPGTGGTFVSFQVIGINNSGQVAWISNIAGGTTPRAIFVGTPSTISKVVAFGDPAPGTTGTFVGLPNNPILYFLNDSGNVAFATGVSGGGATTNGIWIGDGSGPPTKLVVNTDPTGTTLGGNFGSGTRVRGFNSAGKVLFQSDPDSGASSSHALFLKDLANPAQVVFSRGQAAPGGTTESFEQTLQASLNPAGSVAFLARLSGGPAPMGWFLGSGTAAPVKIALEGETTPAGGTFGLAGRFTGPSTPAIINSSGQVLFAGDIIGPNGVGLFRFTPGFGIVAVMTTAENLPSGANSIVNGAGASDDQLVFYARKAGGRSTVFTKPLNSGGGGITRRVGEGDPAPVVGGVLWNISPFFGLINNSEEVAFTADSIVGGTPYPTSGIFSHKPGIGTQKIVTVGDPAPGGGILIDAFLAETHPRINSSGQVVFFSDISTGDGGIFIGSVIGGVQKIVRSGDPNPSGPGTIDGFPIDVESNDSGQVAFGATIETPGPVFTNALFVGSGTSAPMKVVAVGDPGPGGSSVSQIGTFFRINSLGEVGYRAQLSGGSAPSGVFIGAAGGPQSAVALAGSAAPGTGGGAFASFADVEIDVNSSSKVVFFASLTGSSATGGYFVGSASTSPSARLIEGQSLPGGGSVGVISPIGTTNLLNSGDLSLQLFTIAGAPNLFRQVVISSTGVVSELAKDGDKAAGTGSSFGESFSAVPSTNQDRLVFSAVMVDGPTKFAIFSDK